MYNYVGNMGSMIRCLYLSAMVTDFDYTLMPSELITTTKVFPNLQDLTIALLNANVLFELLTRMCELSALTHLKLLKCADAEVFMSCFTQDLKSQASSLRLKTLAVDFNEIADDKELYDYCLADFLRRCRAIHSLHLRWPEEQFAVQKLTNHLTSTGKHLKLLSLASYDQDNNLDPRGFEQICAACPALQQLGYWLPEESFLTPLYNTTLRLWQVMLKYSILSAETDLTPDSNQ